MLRPRLGPSEVNEQMSKAKDYIAAVYDNYTERKGV